MTKIINKGTYGFNACGQFFPRDVEVEVSDELADTLVKKYNQAGSNFYFITVAKTVEVPVERQPETEAKPIEFKKRKRGCK